MQRRLHVWLECTAVLATFTSSCHIAPAQVTSFDRNRIFIDPAHGGGDTGARLADETQEKDVTLGAAINLRSALLERGFVVTMARNGDSDGGSLDERAELANRSHAVACLILHASASSIGVVVGTSALGTALMRGVGGEPDKTGTAIAWNRAQEPYAAQSGRLANRIGTALADSNLPVAIMRVVMRPLDNLTCAAVSVELGKRPESDASSTRADFGTYQQRVAESIADALARWRSEAQGPGEPPLSAGLARGATP